MIRKIINIDKEKCDGCGACVKACHEDAIGLIDGKATLLRDDYCDGLGDCLPTCHVDAISFIEREALEFDAVAVKLNQEKKKQVSSSCQGMKEKQIEPQNTASMLRQWPVQIKLVATNAAFFENANLLISADCCAYAYGNFHQDFMKDKVTIIGCPKLDSVQYAIKLNQIFNENNIKSITVARMQVPCCGGLEQAVKLALAGCGKKIDCKIITINSEGKILG